MRLYTTERSPKTIPVGAILMAPLFALPMGAWIIEQGNLDLGVCGMKQAFDLPCLSCGATRATMALLDGDLLAALSLQPLIITVYFLLTIWGMASLGTFIRDRKLVLDLNRFEDIAFKVSLVALPLINWAYLVWRGV